MGIQLIIVYNHSRRSHDNNPDSAKISLVNRVADVMNIVLTPEQEKFIESQISRGRYVNGQEIIDRALQLLEQQEQEYERWIQATRQKVMIGIEQLEKGEKVDGEVVVAQLQNKFKEMRQGLINEEV